MSKVKYSVQLQTENSRCIVYLNGIKVLKNSRSPSGTMFTGFDGTPFLENGSNSMTLLVSPVGEQEGTYNFSKPAMCAVSVIAKTPKKNLIISDIVVEASETLSPTAKKSINYEGGELTTQVIEKKSSNLEAYEVKRSFSLKEVPQWAWTTATPFTQTPENMQKLRDAYMEVWMAINKKDLEKMKKLMKLSVDEEAQHAGISSGLFFRSYGFEDDFNKSKGALNVDFSKYKLCTYRGGRLIQLKNKYGTSPLINRMTESHTHHLTPYNPFLSLINGKVVISR